MHIIDIAGLFNKVGSSYKLVILAARRAIEIGEGAPKLVDTPSSYKPLHTAIAEILNDKITFELKDK